MKKLAIVTGATGYVGKACASKLADAGFEVLRLSLRGEDGSTALDLTDASAVEAYLTERGPAAVLVHAAGIAPSRGALLDATAASVREQLEANFLAGFHIIAACARGMKERGSGVIVGITSEVANEPAEGKGMGAYVAAKSALHGFLAQLGAELQGSGVAVREIAPGFMDGGMNAALPRAFVEMARVKRGGALMTADDVAEAVVTSARRAGL